LSLNSEGFSTESLQACINFHSNPTIIEAAGSVRITSKKIDDIKTVDRTFLQGQSVELFRAAIIVAL
jgi:hypothetical protein